MEILLAVLGGSALAALINQLGEYIRARKNHDEHTQDKENEDIETLKEGMRCILFSTIREIGQDYLSEGEIDFDDRRILNDMYSLYHSGLNGKENLNGLIEGVNKLPLKI